MHHVLFPQFNQMAAQAMQYGDELRNTKGEIAEINRLIGRLQSEMEAVKRLVVCSLLQLSSLMVRTVLRHGNIKQ